MDLNPHRYDRLADYLKVPHSARSYQTTDRSNNDNICVADVLQFGVREKAFFEYISHPNIVQLRQVVTTEKGG